jgi:broad specificity phosphatase PhoE
MPTRLLLVRHGESPHNLDPRLVSATATGLTPRGVRQAEWLAAYLAEHRRIDGLYTSTLDRARRTAEIVGARTGLVPRVVADLREWDFGDCEGLTPAQIKARYPGQLSLPPARDDLAWGWPGGESRGVFYARALREQSLHPRLQVGDQPIPLLAAQRLAHGLLDRRDARVPGRPDHLVPPPRRQPDDPG